MTSADRLTLERVRSRSSAGRSPLVVDRWLHEWAPSPAVAGVLRCVWSGDLAQMAVPIPDECVDLIWVGGELWVCGPETHRRPRQPAAGSPAVGVRFRPGHGPRVLGVDATELLDSCVPLSALTGDRRARLASDAMEGGQRAPFPALEVVVDGLADGAGSIDEVSLELGNRIRHGAAASLRQLAVVIGRSERDLRRRSRSAFGYGPATLTRITRLQRLLELARCSPRPLAELAAVAGYADQPHMTRDVRALTGTTPARLLQAGPPHPAEAAGDQSSYSSW